MLPVRKGLPWMEHIIAENEYVHFFSINIQWQNLAKEIVMNKQQTG